MILENETIQKYGYAPSQLNPQTVKKIVVRCDYCQNIFERTFNSIRMGRVITPKDSCSNGCCRTAKYRDSIHKKYPNGFSRRSKFNEFKRKPIKVGKKYGFLETIEEPTWERSKGSFTRQFVICRCICGSVDKYRVVNLKSKKTKSCGCKSKELQKRASTTHGQSKDRIYRTWNGMLSRCNENNTSLPCECYRRNKIKVCEEWKNDFTKFRDWAYANGYDDHLTIDRINPYKNYEPSNCQFITIEENAKRVTAWRDDIIRKQEIKIVELEKQNETLLNLIKNNK